MLTYFWLLNKEIKEDHREPLLIALRLKKKKKRLIFVVTSGVYTNLLQLKINRVCTAFPH